MAVEVVIFRDEGLSGKRSDNRPGLQAALKTIGKGDALVVYSLSRLSRSTKDTLVLSDFERDQISDRTRFALAQKRDKDKKTGEDVPFGYRVREGKLYRIDEEQKTIALILELAGKGESLRGICRAWRTPTSLRSKSRKPWTLPSRFQMVSPCRTIINSILPLKTQKGRKIREGFYFHIRLRRQSLTALAEAVDPGDMQAGIGGAHGVPGIGGQEDDLLCL